MKKLLFIMIVGICFTQTYEDVVILKNGSEIHGIIIEQKPNEYIKIQSGRNIFVFQMDEIELMKKELKLDSNSNTATSSEVKESNIRDKTKSVSLGLGTNKSFNLLQISKDYRLTDNIKYFIYAGIPNLLGLGLTSQSNYNENGIIAALNYGIDFSGFGNGSLSVAYQWRLDKGNSFFSLGLSLWSYTILVDKVNGFGEVLWQDPVSVTLPVTVISYDFRF